jgi:hypothetical protein
MKGNKSYHSISGQIRNRFSEKTPSGDQKFHERYPEIQRIDIHNSDVFDISTVNNVRDSNITLKSVERINRYQRINIFNPEVFVLLKNENVRKFFQIRQNAIELVTYPMDLDI